MSEAKHRSPVRGLHGEGAVLPALCDVHLDCRPFRDTLLGKLVNEDVAFTLRIGFRQLYAGFVGRFP